MKLTQSFLRMTNHLFMKHIPGDILTGKHRIWPKLMPKHKRHLLRRVDQEINNMKLLTNPFVTSKESEFVDQRLKAELSAQKETEKREKIRANKRKIEDQYMSKHFDYLIKTRVWE